MNAQISPFLWFDHEAEEAAQLYTSIFANSQVPPARCRAPRCRRRSSPS